MSTGPIIARDGGCTRSGFLRCFGLQVRLLSQLPKLTCGFD